MIESTPTCLNCGSTQEEVPMLLWWYQGREFWMCAACLPVIIHKREQLMEKWPPQAAPEQSSDS